jgi:hypothetical protein
VGKNANTAKANNKKIFHARDISKSFLKIHADRNYCATNIIESMSNQRRLVGL